MSNAVARIRKYYDVIEIQSLVRPGNSLKIMRARGSKSASVTLQENHFDPATYPTFYLSEAIEESDWDKLLERINNGDNVYSLLRILGEGHGSLIKIWTEEKPCFFSGEREKPRHYIVKQF